MGVPPRMHSYPRTHARTHTCTLTPMYAHRHRHSVTPGTWEPRVVETLLPTLGPSRTVRPPWGRVAAPMRGPEVLGALVPTCQPLGSSAAASWALGFAWLARAALCCCSGPPWAARGPRRFHSPQHQTGFRLVQESGGPTPGLTLQLRLLPEPQEAPPAGPLGV